MSIDHLAHLSTSIHSLHIHRPLRSFFLDVERVRQCVPPRSMSIKSSSRVLMPIDISSRVILITWLGIQCSISTDPHIPPLSLNSFVLLPRSPVGSSISSSLSSCEYIRYRLFLVPLSHERSSPLPGSPSHEHGPICLLPILLPAGLTARLVTFILLTLPP